jgi:hypothetical protein
MKPYQLNEQVHEVEAQLHVCLHREAVLHNYDDSCFVSSRVEVGEGGESSHAELCRSIRKLTLRDVGYVCPGASSMFTRASSLPTLSNLHPFHVTVREGKFG